jgi:hypothetical protein
MTKRTIGLAEIMQKAVKTQLLETHTSMPAVIISYDREKQTASVQPAIKRRYLDGVAVNLPIIQNVPVQFSSNKHSFVHFDLYRDDEVLLIFSERSIDNWVKKGGVVESTDKRMHSITDAFCVPGVRSEKKTFTPEGPEGSFEITNDGNSFIISKDGKIKINNSENELVAVMVELLTEMISGKNLTGVGPLEKSPDYIAKLDGIKVKMESFLL